MSDQPSASSTLLDMMVGKWVSRAICAAAELGIADLLKDGPLSSAEIAARIGTAEDGVYRLLRALARIGIFTESEGQEFALTALGTCLRSDVPESMRGYARFLGHDFTWGPWGQLVHSVKTGRPACDFVFGMPAFDYARKHPEVAAVLNAGMTSLSAIETLGVVNAYDFAGVRTLVDVGGGQGWLLASILTANPGMRGVLFELPHVLESARSLLEREMVSDRCETVSGDFFAAVPKGGDAYIMKRVLHDWDDERSIRILRNCRQAMNPGGKILVVEVVVDSPNASTFATFLDLQMLVMTGGRERTVKEFQVLYETAGFKLARIVATRAPVSVIEGISV